MAVVLAVAAAVLAAAASSGPLFVSAATDATLAGQLAKGCQQGVGLTSTAADLFHGFASGPDPLAAHARAWTHAAVTPERGGRSRQVSVPVGRAGHGAGARSADRRRAGSGDSGRAVREREDEIRRARRHVRRGRHEHGDDRDRGDPRNHGVPGEPHRGRAAARAEAVAVVLRPLAVVVRIAVMAGGVPGVRAPDAWSLVDEDAAPAAPAKPDAGMLGIEKMSAADFLAPDADAVAADV